MYAKGGKKKNLKSYMDPIFRIQFKALASQEKASFPT